MACKYLWNQLLLIFQVHFADGSPAVESHSGDWDPFAPDEAQSCMYKLLFLLLNI